MISSGEFVQNVDGIDFIYIPKFVLGNEIDASKNNRENDPHLTSQPTFEEHIKYDKNVDRSRYFVESKTNNEKRSQLLLRLERKQDEELKQKARGLRLRLLGRPRDRRALVQLGDILFCQRDYISTVCVLRKALDCGENSGQLFIKLARCFLHRWYADGRKNINDIATASKNYIRGLQDPSIASPTTCNPHLYHELAVVQIRIGKHQSALDVLSACLVLIRPRQDGLHHHSKTIEYQEDWSAMCEYAIAVTMYAHDRPKEALQVYKRLLVLPAMVTVEQDAEFPNMSPPLLPTRIWNSLVQIEAARCYELIGNTKMAYALYVETWQRLNSADDEGNSKNSARKATVTPEEASEGQRPSSAVLSARSEASVGTETTAASDRRRGKGVIYWHHRQGQGVGRGSGPKGVGDADLRCGATDLKQWRSSHGVLYQLACVFQREGNITMAADFLLQAWERLVQTTAGRWEALSDDLQETALNYLLLRAECLHEICLPDKAEECAVLAVTLSHEKEGRRRELETVSQGNNQQRRRSSVVSVSVSGEEDEILACDAVVLVRAALCCRPDSVDPQIQEIVSEGTIVLRAVHLTQKWTKAVKLRDRIRQLKIREAAASKINAFVRMILTRNRVVGLFLMSAPLLPNPSLRVSMLDRLPLRGLLKSGRNEVYLWLQLWNSTATRLQKAVRASIHRRRKFAFWKGMKTLQRIIRAQLCRLRLRAVVQDLIEFLEFSPDEAERAEKSKSCPFVLPWDSVQGIGGGGLCISGDRNDVSRQLMTRQLPIEGAEDYDDLSASLGSLPGIPSSISKIRKNRFPKLVDTYRKPVTNSPFSPQTAPAKIGNKQSSKSLSPISTLSARSVSENKSGPRKTMVGTGSSPIGGYNGEDRNEWGSMDDSPEVSLDSLYSGRTDGLSIRSGEVMGLVSIQGLSLQAERSSETSNEVSGFVAYRHSSSGESRETYRKWVPFGLLPDRAVISMLQCSTLFLTSPSLRPHDIHRLCRIANQKPHLWKALRSIVFMGTFCGRSAFHTMLTTGIRHLQSFTLINCGLSHLDGKLLGSHLMSSPDVLVNLMELNIEGEVVFGDRGAQKMFPYLQRNQSLRKIRLARCGLRDSVAAVISRYMCISSQIQEIFLPGNHFSAEGSKTLLRGIAQCGIRGSLRNVHIENQQPPLVKDAQLQLLELGMKTGVRVCTTVSVDFELGGDDRRDGGLTLKEWIAQERKFEERLGEDVDDLELTRLRALLDDMRVGGTLDRASDCSFFKTLFL